MKNICICIYVYNICINIYVNVYDKKFLTEYKVILIELKYIFIS